MRQTISKVYSLLLTSKQKGFASVIILTCILLLIETLSVGLVVPIFAAITDDNFLNNIPALGNIANQILPNGWIDENNRITFSKMRIIVSCGIIVITVFFIRVIALLLIYWRINGYISGIKFKLSEIFFKGYISLPYVYHLKSETAVLHNNLTKIYEVGESVESLFTIISETLIIFCLLSLLFYTDFYSTIILAILYPSAIYLITSSVRNEHKNLAKRSYHHAYKRIKFINDAFRSIKEIKILGKTINFIENFSLDTRKQVAIIRKEKLMGFVPRFSFEILFVSSIFLILIILNYQEKSNAQLIPLLALFAAAGLRLMPSVTRIANNLQNLIKMTPFIDIIFDDYQKFLKVKESQNKKEFLDFKKNIKLKNVSFSFSKKSKKILSDINLSVKNGEFIGVIGKSGSGKTTFADLIMGLVEPTSGLVEIDNTPLSKLEIRTWQDKVGYVPQNIYLTNDSIKNNIAYGLRNEDIDNSKLQKAIDKAELQDFIEESDDGINTIIGEGGKRISGGQKQRIGIARALYHNPKILILDESTSSLDKNTEKKIFNTIHKFKGQITVIIISHDKSILEGSDHIYEIQNGKFKEN